MKILQINSTDLFSTGNIMLHIADVARLRGYEVYTASKYQRMSIVHKGKKINHFYIGNRIVNTFHRYFSWITDLQDCASIFPTLRLIYKIEKMKPDIIHLHDVVGWYLNIDILFLYLKKINIPIIWTFHDCWAITGRCIYFDAIGCNRWQIGCGNCPQKKYMPGTWFFDLSAWNFKRKERLFTNIENMTIVTPSEWLKNLVHKSFLKKYNTIVINNGIDLNIFKPTKGEIYNKIKRLNSKIVLGVAATWSQRKGLNTFLQMDKELPENFSIVLVGIDSSELPINRRIIAIRRTNNQSELAEIYSAATVFANPTIEDNFPTVNLESLACGTPIVTFQTGGSPESIDEQTGIIVKKNDVKGFISAILEVTNKDKNFYAYNCRKRSLCYDMNSKFNEYVDLYDRIIKQ
ncbi:uncharacterized protein BN659_00394 [Bacteroides sp. CAG:443]|nr:uncharacterized protein BN659_00394 [Bacteroides sp. CAG:443]